MKKIYLVFIFLFSIVFLNAATTYTFRMTNPRILYTDIINPDKQALVFDYEVMSDANSYMNNLQIVADYNIAALSTSGSDYLFTGNAANNITSDKYNITFNLNGNRLNLFINSKLPEPGFNATWLAFFPANTWTRVGTVKIAIVNNSITAGVFFNQGFMNNTPTEHRQRERISASGVVQDCLYPNVYQGSSFVNLYLGRIYSKVYGWSQYGGTVKDVLFTDWTAAVNTSVWDTATAAAHITETGSKASALRIHSGARLLIDAGKDLTCTGPAEINEIRGLRTVANQTGQAQFLDNGTVTYNNGGSFTADIYITQNSKWHYYCPAVTLPNYRPFYFKYMKYYNEYDATNAPTGMGGPFHSFKYIINSNFSPDTTVLPVMTGYAMWSAAAGPYVSPPLSTPSGPVNTGIKSYTVNRSPWITQTPPYDGWNLIGNPYPSAIDLSSGNVAWGDVEQTAWFWNGDNYVTYIKGGSGTKSTSFAAPQQAFFVHHTTANATPTIFSLNNATRVINAEPFLKEGGWFADQLNLEARSAMNGTSDLAVVRFASDAKYAYEEGTDAAKLWGNYDAPQLYSILSMDNYLTVNVLPYAGNTQIIPLGFYCGVTGQYSIIASNLESFTSTQIFLRDKKRNIWQELTLDPVYTFDYIAGEDEGRFELHFLQFITGINDADDRGMKIYSWGEELFVMNLSDGNESGDVQLYDLTGRRVFGSLLESSRVSRYHPDVAEGYYAARVTTPHGIYTQKIYLK